MSKWRENGMPRMTRGWQAARREGKRPLNPASSREGRQAIAGARQAAGRPGKQPEKLSKRPLSKRGGGAGKQPENSKQLYR